MNEIWAVIPVKGFDRAKSRLGGVFSTTFRQRLAAVMVEDVLTALSGAAGLGGILVVTEDAAAGALARRYGAAVSAEGAADGHTGAVLAGGRWLRKRGCGGMLSLPGDVPGVTAREIDMLLGRHADSAGFTIVPAHDRRGSNAVVASPPEIVPLAYGNDSFLPHLAAARAAGVEPLVVELAGIGLDVDGPEDLFSLMAQGWPTRTQAFLEASAEFVQARDG